MRRKLCWLIYSVTLFSLIAGFASKRPDSKQVLAQSGAEVSVSVEVVVDEETHVEIRISGYTIPFSHVKIVEDSQVLIEKQLSEEGFFDFRFSVSKDSVHEYVIYAEYAGDTTNPVVLTIDPNAWDSEQTTGLVLPPILKVATRTVVYGDELILYGFGPRDAQITAYTSLRDEPFFTTSDAEGRFEFKIITEDFEAGLHTAYVTATVDDTESNQSNAVEFSISEKEYMRPVYTLVDWFNDLPVQAKAFMCLSIWLVLVLIGIAIWIVRRLYVVTGVVYDVKTRKPVPDVLVKIKRYGDADTYREQMTDQKGEFYFNIKPGSFHFSVQKDGYISYENVMYIRRGGKRKIWIEIFLTAKSGSAV